MGRISSPRFVGRVVELDMLERLVARAASGTGRAVLVAGEAGIGKSRLVSELEDRARGRDVRVLIGDCVELAEGELAFAPVISALREVMEEALSAEWLEPRPRSALAALWPVIGVADPEAGGRELLFEAVYRVLARVAQARPVLLIVEDVHWIDPSSRDLVAFLLRNARHDRIAVVATYRPDELHRGHPLRPFVTELERSGRAERIDLAPLQHWEVAEQLAAIAGRAPAGDVVERIFVRCEGNPFFAEELFASADTGAGELPGSLREALLLRIERLPELTREVLRVAAVVGRLVDHRLLASVVGVAEPDLLVALREAADHHVLVPSADGAAYRFRHALLRDAIYDDTLPGERLRLHRAIAQTLDAHREYAVAGAAAELAYHWLAAGEQRAALAASVEAANQADAMHAHDEAAGQIDRALALWEGVANPDEVAGCDRIELLLRGSELADFSGDAVHGLELAEQARAAVDEHLDPLRAARAEARIGRSLQFSGRGADAIEHLAEARRLVPSDPPTIEYVQALAAEGRVLMLNERYREAQGRLEDALALAGQLGARTVQASALISLAITYSDLGDFDRSVAAGREGLRIAEEVGSVEEIMRAYVNGSQAIEDAGMVEQALAMGVEGIREGERLGMSRVAGDILRCQAMWRLLRLGRLSEAEAMIKPVLDRASTPFNFAGSRSCAGRLAIERGDLEQAREHIEAAWPLMQRSGGFQLIGPALTSRVLLELRAGDLPLARERAAEGRARVVRTAGNLLYNAELYWLAVRVEAELAERARTRGDSDGLTVSEQTALAALSEFDAGVANVPGKSAPPEAMAFKALAGAELTRVRAEHDPAVWVGAANRFRAIGEVYPAAYADFRAAEALALAGARQADVAVPLRAAYQVAVDAGSPPFLGEVVGLARRTGITLAGRGEQPDDGAPAELGLTDRELEVLRLLGDGRTNRQIGEELFITPKTASVHVSRILTKLGLTNRTEAAAAAHRMGLTRH